MSDDPVPSRPVIKGYVWHGDKCFFVSTVERTSSAAANPCRYNETMVWAYNFNARERGELLHQGEAPRGSIRTHQQICQALYDTGNPPHGD